MRLINVENINYLKYKREGQYYVPSPLFDSHKYANVRVEVKWAYVAVLNVLINNEIFDGEKLAFVNDDDPALIDTLKKLANKRVDQEKIDGYLNELQDLSLAVVNDHRVYLRNIESE